MKIVHITYMLTFGGIETMLVNIANEQVKHGHQVEIIIVEKRKIDDRLVQMLDSSIRIHQAKRIPNIRDIMAVARINWYLLIANPDVIHIHSSGLMRCILFPEHRQITSCTIHDIPTSQNTVAIKSVPRVFSISEAVQRGLKYNYNVDSIVVYNGIHPEKIKVRRQEDKQKCFRMVMVSRLHYEKKGQDILIEAVKELQNRGYDNVLVDLIGDGESRTFLEKRCKDLGVENKIQFLGTMPQEHIFEHLADYNLFVQPSRHEGFALTVAEAMAARVPVLVSSGQGPEEVVEYGKCGYIFKNGDVFDCANKIEEIIKDGEDIVITERAYDRVWNLFNVKLTAKMYLENYFSKKKQ